MPLSELLVRGNAYQPDHTRRIALVKRLIVWIPILNGRISREAVLGSANLRLRLNRDTIGVISRSIGQAKEF